MFNYSSQKMFLKTENGNYVNLLHVQTIERVEGSVYAVFEVGTMERIASCDNEKDAIEYMDKLFG